MSKQPKTETELSGGATPQKLDSSRPRYQDVRVDELGADLRIRRMEPEGLYAQIKHLERVGIGPGQLATTTVTPENRAELCRLIQRCLVKQPRGLAFPGGNGLKRLHGLTDTRVQQLAQTIGTFLGL